MLKRPEAGEYPAFYANYIQQVPDRGDLLDQLEEQTRSGLEFYGRIPGPIWDEAYATGKWTLKEAFVHMLDTERIFAYRALRIARGDQTPLPGFEQDDYVPQSAAASRRPGDLLTEYRAVRAASQTLFKSFSPEMWARQGKASGGKVSVRAIGYMLAGHELHHVRIIKERYLNT